MLKHFWENFRKKSIVWQVTVVFSLITLIPSIAITISYFHIVQNSILEESQKNLKQYLKKMGSNMSANINIANYTFKDLNFSQEFTYYLDPDNLLSDREKNHYINSIQVELLNIHNMYPNKFSSILIYSKNRQISQIGGWSYPLESLYKTDYYHEITDNDGEIIYGNVRIYDNAYGNLAKYPNLENEKEQVLPVYNKIYNISTGEFIGMIELDISLKRLIDIESLATENPSITYMLFDNKNNLLYSNNKIDPKDCGSLSFQGNSGLSNEILNHTNYMVAYDRDAETGLMRVVVINEKEVYATSNGIKFALVLIAVICLICIILLTSLTAHIMFRKLKDMTNMISQIESGKFDVRVETCGFKEISSIAESFNHMAKTLQTTIQSMIEREKAQKEAELYALQVQINPHFLYNTLDSMRMKCEIDSNYQMANSIQILGSLLHYSLNWESKSVPLKEEMQNVRNYIQIMRMRFRNKFQYEIEFEPGCLENLVPKFILQPLVENCFSHAFLDVNPPWNILVKAVGNENRLTIKIIDNGIGIEPCRLAQINEFLNGDQPNIGNRKSQHSIGIANVRQRIELLCKKGSSLSISSELGRGTQITIIIILEEKVD